MKDINKIQQKIQEDGVKVLYRAVNFNENKFYISLNVPDHIDKHKLYNRFIKSSLFKIIDYAVEEKNLDMSTLAILMSNDDLSMSGNLYIDFKMNFNFIDSNTLLPSLKKVKEKFTEEFNISFDSNAEEYVSTGEEYVSNDEYVSNYKYKLTLFQIIKIYFQKFLYKFKQIVQFN